LEAEIAEIEEKQHNVIPVIQYDCLEEELAAKDAEIKKRGVVVVRGVVGADTARDWKQGVQDYAKANPSHTGYPRDNPQVLELYWSKSQMEARQHPHMHATMLGINSLWQSSGEHVNLSEVFSYGERLRIRQRGDATFALGPHVDGGSIERWEDKSYQQVYKDILAGNWEAYDAWQADMRTIADTSMYNDGLGSATVFRAYQGWMAVSQIGPVPHAGTLQVLPLLKEATAFLLLRPFLSDVPENDFCGAYPGKGHDLMPEFHAKLLRAVTPIPDMNPGDTVWWHSDLVHAVESQHDGIEDSSVFYIPSLPLSVKNAVYIQDQRERFLSGRTPADFPPNDSEVDFVGRSTEADLSPLGRKMMGFEPVGQGANSSLSDDCNRILVGTNNYV
jgi:hypothetical protein